jgi:phage terminase large subunit-like protein
VRGAEVIDFIQGHCFLVQGDGGRPLFLAPWQQAEIRKIYDSPAGTRRHILSVARKNSKTTLCACLMLNHLCGPSARRDTELFSSALSRDQAALLYTAAAKMVRLNPVLRRIIRIRETAKEQHRHQYASRLRCRSSLDPDRRCDGWSRFAHDLLAL